MKDKTKVWDRILLALYALLGFVATVVIAIAMCSGMQIELMGHTIRLGSGVWPVLLLAVVAAALLVWSVRLMMMAFGRGKRKSEGSVALKESEAGTVRVSLEAIETLARQAIGNNEGVEKIDTQIINRDDSVSVNIDMVVRSDVHIPNVTLLMQQAVKNFIEEYSGIAVRDVTVIVSHIIESPMLPPVTGEATKGIEAGRSVEGEEAAQGEEPAPEEAPGESAQEEAQAFEDEDARDVDAPFVPEDDFEKMWGVPGEDEAEGGEAAGAEEAAAGEAGDASEQDGPAADEEKSEKDIW